MHVPLSALLRDQFTSLTVEKFRLTIHSGNGVSDRPESSADGAFDILGKTPKAGKKAKREHDEEKPFPQKSEESHAEMWFVFQYARFCARISHDTRN